MRVRLAQIDAPEHSQAFGTRPRQKLTRLVFKRDVHVQETDKDRYGRVLGAVCFPQSLTLVVDGVPEGQRIYGQRGYGAG